jgi:hypothetical protein
MENEVKPSNSKAMFYTGWLLTILSGLALLASSIFKFMPPMNAEAEQGLQHIGWRADQLGTLGILEIVSAILYLIPQTAVIGAILISGYMGGAIATHLRVGDPVVVQVIIPIVAWLGLWLRDGRLREILPLR